MRPRIAFFDPGELSFPAQKSSGTLMRFAPQKPALRYLRLLLLIFCPAVGRRGDCSSRNPCHPRDLHL